MRDPFSNMPVGRAGADGQPVSESASMSLISSSDNDSDESSSSDSGLLPALGAQRGPRGKKY